MTLWNNGCYRCDSPSPATPTSAGNTRESGWTIEPLHMLLVSSRELFIASNALRVPITLDPLTRESSYYVAQNCLRLEPRCITIIYGEVILSSKD